MNKIQNLKKIFNLIFSEKNNLVFYSLVKAYKKYLFDFIFKLNENEEKIIYLSSEIDDKIYLKNVNNIYIGKGILRNIIFQTLNAKFFFLTITDLDNHDLKKSKTVKNYIYIFHAANSIHRSYTKNAFDNYDIIFCNGDYHLNEFYKDDIIKSKRNRKYIKSGYFYFDYLIKKIRDNKELINIEVFEKTILIAPSWNYNKKNFFDIYSVNLIRTLLSKNKKVIFRPHPEHYKRSENILKIIRKEFMSHCNFSLDIDVENFYSMSKSSILITDYSGISLEYCLIFKKPVIYFDKYLKLHNPEYKKIFDHTIEDKVKESFGVSFFSENLDDIFHIIEIAKNNFSKPEVRKSIETFLQNNFYNLNNSIEYAYKEYKTFT